MKFLRKPLAILSGVLLLAGLVLTVVLALLPHGGTYVLTTKEGDTEAKAEITFKGDKVYTKSYVNGELLYEDKDGQDYYIKGGKLYMMTKEAYDTAVEAANKLEGTAKDTALKALDEAALKINAFKITPSNTEGATKEQLKAATYVCSANNALLYVGIVLMAVGVVGAVVACVFIMNDKKGSKPAATEAKA